ncbi:MAG: RNA polymerase sigma factor [Ignavibacteriae bacterium]|nr:RNA polymerase sigma factor [Ignavibacteriota bacterium]NOG98522.1 RNA polymerase sigma factor [Ignavibacteriota bacterium]
MKETPKKIIEFTITYNKYKLRIYNYVLKMVSDKMLCEDIVQNIFLKFYENMDLIKNKNSISYWLFKTARNDIYSFFRSKKVKSDQFNVLDVDEVNKASSENLEIEYEKRELKNIVLNELDNLPDEQKEIYLLKEYGGLSYKEVAGIMEIDENLVKSRLYKTRQKLISLIRKVET